MTALPELSCAFVEVGRERGRQLKEPAQLDEWLRRRVGCLRPIFVRLGQLLNLVYSDDSLHTVFDRSTRVDTSLDPAG